MPLPASTPTSPRRPIRARGSVLAVHSPDHALVRMRNGHQVLAYRPPAEPPIPPVLAPGLEVELEFNPCDMAHARILPQED